jgi:hypothetical protein
MRENLSFWISQCETCEENKPSHTAIRAPLGSMLVGALLDRIATDLLGPLPIPPRGNKSSLVITDYFTKWVEVFPVPDQTAVTCAQIILNDVICRFGCQVFQELCEILEIRKN